MHPQFQDDMRSPFTPVTNTPPVFPHPNGGLQPNGVNYGTYGHIQGQPQHQQHHQSPHGPQRPAVQTSVPPYGVLSPASQQRYHGQHPNGTPQSANPYSGQNTFPPAFTLPPSNFQPTAPSPHVTREGGQDYVPQHAINEHFQGAPQPASEMIMLDNMTSQTTIPVFGSDSVLNKSPYVGMPEDFMAYLFNTQGADGAAMNQMMPQYTK